MENQMTEDLRMAIVAASITIEFNERTRYLCACRASIAMIKRWHTEHPVVRGSKPTQTIYMLPELSHKLGSKEEVQKTADELKTNLGEGYDVQVCALKSTMIFEEGFYVEVENGGVITDAMKNKQNDTI